MFTKSISYLLTVVYYVFFAAILFIFHGIQFVALNCFGHRAHNAVVAVMSLFVMRSLNILGARLDFDQETPLPKNTPLILVSNHQSTYDLPPIIWYLRKHHPKFISKKELGKGIPSVSYNLRKGGSLLIDRNDRKASLNKIKKFTEKLNKNKWSVVIYPEGTRSKTGDVRKFQKGGLTTLMTFMPEAYIVPISIQNSWQLAKHNYMPIPLGVKLIFKVHQPIKNDPEKISEIIQKVELLIREELKSA